MTKKILYVQLLEPGAYPPIMNSAKLFVENNWRVKLISAPIRNKSLRIDSNNNFSEHRLFPRNSHVITKAYLFYYLVRTLLINFKFRATYIYLSDPISSVPGFFLKLFFRVKLVYHEHDTPSNYSGSGQFLSISRKWVLKNADLVIFPNEQRAIKVQQMEKIEFKSLFIVWNVPLLSNCNQYRYSPPKNDLWLYYHGSINIERLPYELFQAIAKFNGKVKIKIVGYEAPGSIGYISKLEKLYNINNKEKLIHYVGSINHEDLHKHARDCHVGVCFMPSSSNDINMECMVGASNKVFEYMSFGLPVLVSEKNEWVETFVYPGFGYSCDSSSSSRIYKQLDIIIQSNNLEILSMKAHNQILSNWNYDKFFGNVIYKLK